MSILRELIPSATVVGLPVNPDNPDIDVVLRDVQEASRTLGFQVVLLQVRSAGDFDSAFASFVRQRANAVLLGFDQMFLAGRHQLIVLAARHGLPAIFEQRESALAGGLISYGPSATESYRQAGSYVGRILKGAKPPSHAADQVRVGHQPEDRKSVRPRSAADAARPRGRGDRISCHRRYASERSPERGTKQQINGN